MPSLTPVTEGSETLAALTEGSETLTVFSEGTETLTALAEGVEIPDVTHPALYPSAALTYPSAAGTYPSPGLFVAGSGKHLTALGEGTETLTPFGEA